MDIRLRNMTVAIVEEDEPVMLILLHAELILHAVGAAEAILEPGLVHHLRIVEAIPSSTMSTPVRVYERTTAGPYNHTTRSLRQLVSTIHRHSEAVEVLVEDHLKTDGARPLEEVEVLRGQEEEDRRMVLLIRFMCSGGICESRLDKLGCGSVGSLHRI
jgi:hypothetical protein